MWTVLTSFKYNPPINIGGFLFLKYYDIINKKHD